MSNELCEIVEAYAETTSECPVTDVIMVDSSAASLGSAVFSGVLPSTAVGAAEAIDQVVVDAYTLNIGEAEASSDVSPTLVVTELLLGVARGKSSPQVLLHQLAETVANAEDEILDADTPLLLLSAAQASSEVVPGSVAAMGVGGRAEARSFATLGLTEALEAGAEATASVVILRRVEETVISYADGVDEVVSSGEPQTFLLLSTASGTSMVNLQSEVSVAVVASAETSSGTWYKDPNRVAWVMNTETSAVSWYDNFDFESIAQTPGKVLAVGPDGLYEMGGHLDAGETIEAHVQSGFSDFGSPQTKRVEAIYFGYTSTGRVSVTAETYESGHPPVKYLLEERSASAPRNSRVRLGKGMRGRYWRMTFRNVDGADFEVHDATVDVAISSRRV